MAKKLSETRKLFVYARNNDFGNVDAVTCLAFFALAEIQVTKCKQIEKIAEPGLISQDAWPCILERVSTLRKRPTYTAGAIQILRFIY